MLIEKVKRTIRKYGMLSSGDRVVVAVSGGPDSVCLLGVLRALAREYGLQLHIAHLDHMFRGAGSAADARFVELLAATSGIPATIEAIDVPAYCRVRGLSAQEGAREVRYRFLDRVAGSVGADKVALGHTANDQAETVVMRLVRGAGLEALSGIPPVREKIIRPLLDTTRAEILSYLKKAALDFVTDPTNTQTLYTRNRIRRNVIPELERLNPNAVAALAAGAALLRDESAALEELVAPVIDGLLRRDGESVRIDRRSFLSLFPAVRRRALRTAVASLGSSVSALSLVQTDEAVSFLEQAQSGRALDLPGGLILERSYDDIVVRPRPAIRAFCVPLPVPGTALLPELSLLVDAQVSEGPSPPATVGNYLWQAEFDYAKIALPLCLRSRRDGDRFCPVGMGGRGKKLQDYFVDEKIPRSRRDGIPLLASEADILWVAGLRTDERFLRGPGTKKYLIVTIREHPSGGRR